MTLIKGHQGNVMVLTVETERDSFGIDISEPKPFLYKFPDWMTALDNLCANREIIPVTLETPGEFLENHLLGRGITCWFVANITQHRFGLFNLVEQVANSASSPRRLCALRHLCRLLIEHGMQLEVESNGAKMEPRHG